MSPIARRKTTPLKTLAAVAAVTLAGAGPQALAQTIFVKGGTLIDGTGAAPTKDARILIQDGVIKGVWSGDEGGQSVPAGVPVVDATGKYIIPGLIDSHVHYNWYQGELFLHYGVTSVFDLGGGSWSHGMQKGVESGAIRAPRYYYKASFGDGANGRADKFAGMNTARSRTSANVNSPADAEAAVNAVVGKADIITLNEDWSGEVFSAISKAAHAKGLSIISHSYNALDTSDWGVDGIEHLTGVGMAATRSEAGKAAIAEMGSARTPTRRSWSNRCRA